MIRFHGGPITPMSVALAIWKAKHACVSWWRAEQEGMAFEVAQSVMLDNGAFSAWTAGTPITDWSDYADWVAERRYHPGFAFAMLPDVIDGTEADNDGLLAWWWNRTHNFENMVPVWHLHESLDRLRYMSQAWPRIAFGSSGDYATVASEAWWARMTEAMAVVCDDEGRPKVRLHGLRMMNATVVSRIPFASVDSTNMARNHARNRKGLAGLSEGMAAMIFADRLESHATAARWNTEVGAMHYDMELVG